MCDLRIIFENGEEFLGRSFGADLGTKNIVLEAVFNTSAVGYQEIISDPSYFGQMVFMTYPLIGSYGITTKDYESRSLCAGALGVFEYSGKPSNCESITSLSEELKRYEIPAICEIDARQIVRMIRNFGSMRVLLTGDLKISKSKSLEIIKNTPLITNHVESVQDRFLKTEFNGVGTEIVVIDCGVKKGILNSLASRNCKIFVLRFDSSAENVLRLNPKGVVFSNGPGDPKDNKTVIELIKQLQDKVPIFGICLGHQLIALANGAETYKMKFGHRGSNHPVKNLKTGKIEITSQNHSYAVDIPSISGTDLELTHINLTDNTAEGLEIKSKKILSVQYHPESSPGPQDSGYLFDEFLNLCQNTKILEKSLL
ncbi:MAG: carbamoyl phosphate synthase small subunit [Oscillospiraceae bacterium]|jgi:carbamoyl-phosphate synthase small subunit|nr:carbamoyl phosphate synthase small subunit [Oscillospiraceae bacterium]